MKRFLIELPVRGFAMKTPLRILAVSCCLLLQAAGLAGQAGDGLVLAPHRPSTPKPTTATLLVSCDLACNWSLDGKPQAAMAADGSATVTVGRTQHLLTVATSDGLDTVRKMVDLSSTPQTVVLIELTPVRAERLRSQGTSLQPSAHDVAQPTQAPVTQRAVSNHNIWVDPATGLVWTREDNGKNSDWNQANNYCSELQLEGLSGWRLPEIDELAAIDDPNVTEQHAGCESCERFHVKGQLRLSANQWSHTQGNASTEMWRYDFSGNRRDSYSMADNAYKRALCVHGGSPRVRAAHDLAGTWTDPATHLMWTLQDNGTELNWQGANSYCHTLQLAGFTDWRLPEISELEAINDRSAEEPNYKSSSSRKLHIKGHLRLSANQWSQTLGNKSGEMWRFDFEDNNRASYAMDDTAYKRALCVRVAQ